MMTSIWNLGIWRKKLARTYPLLVAFALTGFPPSVAHATVASHYFYVMCGYRECIAYDCISFNQATNELVVLGESGKSKTLTVPGLLPTTLRFVEVPWDTNTNLPASVSRTIQPEWFFIYTRFFAGFIANPFGGSFFFLLIVALQLLSAIGRQNYKGLWTILLMPIALAMIGSAAPEAYKADLRAEQMRSRIVAYRLNDSQFLPMPASIVESGSPVTSINLYDSEKTFAIMHLPFLWLLVRAYRGAHYLLAPHPMERLSAQGKVSLNAIVAAMRQEADPENPPPDYKSRNWRRRLEELTKRTEAETELLRSLAKNKRARAEWEDK